MDGSEVLTQLNKKWQQECPELAELNFSKWVPWSERLFLPGIDKKGVYILAKYPSGRVLPTTDPMDKAIICVGKTSGRTHLSKKILQDRLKEFHQAAFGNGKANHAEGETYRKKYGPNPTDLYVSICPVYYSSTPEDVLWKGKAIDPDIRDFKHFRQLHRYITFLEVCLRGTYIYIWGKLPELNKE